jgi:hypothetical protein
VKRIAPTYSLVDEMMASPTEPIRKDLRLHQLTRMWQALASIEKAPKPTTEDWRLCSDAVNLMESLVEMDVVVDASGLLQDAVTALAMAGQRSQAGQGIRLDGAGIVAVRAVLEDYSVVVETIPARTVIRCHRRTERRIRDILAGRGRSTDVEVINL